MFKRILMVAVAIGAVSTPAQNARMESMANLVNIDDVSDLIANPAFMNDYEDLVQVTVGAGGVDPVIGVKSLGEVLSLGTYYRPTRILPAAATAFYSNSTNGTVTVSPIPHALVGMDVGAMQLGVDLYWERVLATYKSETVGGGVTTTVDSSWSFNHPGLNLGVKFSELPVSFNVGAGLPMAKWFEERSVTGAATVTNKAKASGFSGLVGVDVGLKLGGGRVSIGGNGNLVTWKSTTELNATPKVESIKYTNKGFDVYVGLDKKAEKIDALFAILATAALSGEKNSSGDTTKQSANDLVVGLSGCAEKVWTPEFIKFFDKAAVRGGLSYSIIRNMSHAKSEIGGTTSESTTRDGALRTGFTPFIGFGLGRGAVAFDVALNNEALVNAFKLVNGNYNGAGDDFVKATLTVDVGGRKAASAPVAAVPAVE